MAEERLRIQHATRYTYYRPVELHRHRLVIRPREGHDLHIDHMTLNIDPKASITWVRDVFGNSIAWVDFAAPAAELRIHSDVIVTRTAPFPASGLHDAVRVSHPVVYEPLEQPVLAAYLSASFSEDGAILQRWLNSEVTIDAEDAEGTALELCERIHERIAYRRRSEKGVQTPAQTLALLSGSCRDMATLMMECARVLGVASRFASGYLHGSASLAGEASTHAWAEIYLPSLGWRGFDPTLGTMTSDEHIVTGVSNHPRGVMPISGTYSGHRADFREMIVKVTTEVLADKSDAVMSVVASENGTRPRDGSS